MLSEGTVFATVAVKDIDSAKKFYGETLGLKQTDGDPGGVTYTSGTGKILVYPSNTAGSGKATCAAWQVSDVKATVEELKGKGISFEKYDLPGVTWEGDIAVMDSLRAAWFKDPDGNILSVGNS